jgi:hypothetical protein
MPTILIDWVRGNQIVEEERQKLVARHVPDIILASHQSLVDNIAYIQIHFPEYPSDHVFFVIQPHQSFVLECGNQTNEALLAFAANRIAAALGYRVSISERSPFV